MSGPNFSTSSGRGWQSPSLGKYEGGTWHCACDPPLHAVYLRVKKEGPNKGRWFYMCQKPREFQCRFFLWDDVAEAHQKATARNEPSVFDPPRPGQQSNGTIPRQLHRSSLYIQAPRVLHHNTTTIAMLGDVNTPDAAVAVQEWQQNHHHAGSKPEDRSVTARLCDGILDVFQEAMRELSQAHQADTALKPVRRSLERARGLIALWSDGYGIQEGRLDDVLSKSRNIRRLTLKTLSRITNTLLNRLIPLAQISSDKLDILTVQLAATNAEASYVIHDVIRDEYDGSDTSSESFSDAVPDDSMAEVAEDLKTDAQCLMELDPLFRDPVLDLASHKQKHDLEAIDWTPEKAYCDKVQQRFPKAETPLIERLGKANWVRYLRCQEIRNWIEKGPRMQANATDKGDDGTVAASSKYHDSGLGTSLPTASSYAETVMTYGAGGEQRIRIPPLSDEARKGNPFPCLACGRLVRITNNSTWKRHLYVDLEPYLCLELQCSQQSFSSRNDWISHLALDHRYQPAWDAVTCPLCFETTEKGKLAVTTHLAQHLEEISLSALPAYPDEGGDESFKTDSEYTDGSAVETAEDEEFHPGEYRDEEETVRCICGFDDAPEPSGELRGTHRFSNDVNLEEAAGFFIQCDTCKCWQHGLCVGLLSEDSSPDAYYCERCRPDYHSICQDENGNWYSHYINLRLVSAIQRQTSPTTNESPDDPRDRTSGPSVHNGTSTTTNNLNAKERSHSAEDPSPEEPPRPEIPDLGTGTVGDPEIFAFPPVEPPAGEPSDKSTEKDNVTAKPNSHSPSNSSAELAINSLHEVFADGYPNDMEIRFE